MLYKKIHLDKLMTLDIETMKYAFIVCVKDYKTGSKKEFIIYNDKQYEGQAFELFKFLNNCVKKEFTAISYNGAGFDIQILDYFYKACLPPSNTYEEVDILYEFDNQCIIDKIYKKVQEIIGGQTEYMSSKFNEALLPENKLFIPTIDLYKQQHFDRKGCSLKWLEFSMQLPKIQEMPFKHDEQIDINDLQEVIKYCWHDVEATEMFYNKIKHETETRLTLSKEYNLNLYNASEPKMVREIFGKFLCEEMGLTYTELKKLKTIRGKIHLKDIILPYVKFQTQQFKDVLNVFNNTVIDCSPQSEDKFSYTFKFNGLDVDLGMGGIHSCINSGVYELIDYKGTHPPSPMGDKYDVNEYTIEDADVKLIGVLTS